MTDINLDKPVAKLTRNQLEAEAKTITDVKLSDDPKKLKEEGLRSAVRLHRRRNGTGPE